MTTPSNPAPSETPEVDHIVPPNHHSVILKKARELERSRNALRQQVEELTMERNQAREHHQYYQNKTSEFMGVNIDLSEKLSAERTARLAAEAAVEQLRKDGERLDWLGRNTYGSGGDMRRVATPYVIADHQSAYLRDAIDAAMSTSPKQEEA